jgi:carbonic anhydrase
MAKSTELLANNQKWAEGVVAEDPEFFARLAKQQSPKFLWIGCADSRVPANQIIGLQPGGVFVHRNIANLVVHSDANCLSVVQYAVEVLKVEDIIVCGHYGCGGVAAALGHTQFGLIDNWLRHIKDVYTKHEAELRDLDEGARLTRLCELNVIEQASNLSATTIVQNAWARGQELTVHAWIYSLDDGRIKPLETRLRGASELPEIYRMTA